MPFINATESIGLILSSGTTGITGNIVATLLLVLVFLIAVAMLFGIALEVTAIILLPFLLAVGAYYGDFMTPIVITLLYLSAIIAKNFIFR